MEVVYDNHHLIERQKTDLLDEKGGIVLWGIYDFAFKYRTRIFSQNDEELAYVEKDIAAENDTVNIFDHTGKKIDALIRTDGGLYLEKEGLPFSGDLKEGEIKEMLRIREGRLMVERKEDLLKAVALLFSLVEIDR